MGDQICSNGSPRPASFLSRCSSLPMRTVASPAQMTAHADNSRLCRNRGTDAPRVTLRRGQGMSRMARSGRNGPFRVGNGEPLMAGVTIDIPVADGGGFSGYLAVPEEGRGPGLLIEQEIDFWGQCEPARRRRPLRRGRLCLPRARSLLADGARRGPRLRRGRFRQGLRLLPALRRGPGPRRHRCGARCAKGAARVHRQGRRHGLLPRRQARLPHRHTPRSRCGGLVLWRGDRGRARRVRRHRLPHADALRRRRLICAARGRRRRHRPFRGAAGGADSRLSRRRSRLLQPRAERRLSPALGHGRPFAHHRAAAPRDSAPLTTWNRSGSITSTTNSRGATRPRPWPPWWPSPTSTTSRP